MSSAISPEMRQRTGGHDIRIIFDEATIDRRVAELGAEITAAYPEGPLLVLGLLKGSFIFLSDLLRQIDRPLHVDFLMISSYGTEKVSSGDVRLVYDPETPLEGQHILLVEDIIDSGRTMKRLVEVLGQRRPASLAICALLDKKLLPEPIPELRWTGFTAPPAFLVGYGLDHAEESSASVSLSNRCWSKGSAAILSHERRCFGSVLAGSCQADRSTASRCSSSSCLPHLKSGRIQIPRRAAIPAKPFGPLPLSTRSSTVSAWSSR